MDIYGIGQNSIEDIKAGSLWSTNSTEEKKDGSIIGDLVPVSDSASVSQLDNLKNQAVEAQEPGRAAYLEKLKAAVAEGKYEVSSADIADSLVEDGFIDFLID